MKKVFLKHTITGINPADCFKLIINLVLRQDIGGMIVFFIEFVKIIRNVIWFR